jgi:type II secretory pathway pseudopilin PulG
MRAPRKGQDGFALLAVIVLIAIVSAAVAITLDEAVGSIQNAGRVRAAEMIKSALDHGVSMAMSEIEQTDPERLIEMGDPTNQTGWAIFDQDTAQTFINEQRWPTEGPFANYYNVRVGLRSGQVTRAPSGEDARSGFGQIVEVQVSVQTADSSLPPTEERVSVGVLIPRKGNYSN